MTVLGAHLSLRWSEPGAVLTVKPCPVFHEYFRMFAGRILTVPCPPRCTCHPCFSLIGALGGRGTPSPRVSPVILKHVGQAVPRPGAIIHGVFLTAAPPPNPDAGQGKWFRFYGLKMQGLEKRAACELAPLEHFPRVSPGLFCGGLWFVSEKPPTATPPVLRSHLQLTLSGQSSRKPLTWKPWSPQCTLGSTRHPLGGDPVAGPAAPPGFPIASSCTKSDTQWASGRRMNRRETTRA